MPATNGKDAIGKMIKEMMADPNFALDFHGTKWDVAKSGELGYSKDPGIRSLVAIS